MFIYNKSKYYFIVIQIKSYSCKYFFNAGTMKADDNNTFPKNLDFLAKILKGLNLNYTDVAKAAGITPQLVAYWFDHDDIKLSRLTYTMESLNISIECSFERIETQQEVQIKEDEYEIEMENVLKFKRETSRSGFILDQALERNARLVFLAKLIKESLFLTKKDI